MSEIETSAWDGRPQNPERDGWHWVMWWLGQKPIALRWSSDDAEWTGPLKVWHAGSWRYLGPCLTPAERDALHARAASAELEARIAGGAAKQNYAWAEQAEARCAEAEAERDALAAQVEKAEGMAEALDALFAEPLPPGKHTTTGAVMFVPVRQFVAVQAAFAAWCAAAAKEVGDG